MGDSVKQRSHRFPPGSPARTVERGWGAWRGRGPGPGSHPSRSLSLSLFVRPPFLTCLFSFLRRLLSPVLSLFSAFCLLLSIFISSPSPACFCPALSTCPTSLPSVTLLSPPCLGRFGDERRAATRGGWGRKFWDRAEDVGQVGGCRAWAGRVEGGESSLAGLGFCRGVSERRRSGHPQALEAVALQALCPVGTRPAASR